MRFYCAIYCKWIILLALAMAMFVVYAQISRFTNITTALLLAAIPYVILLTIVELWFRQQENDNAVSAMWMAAALRIVLQLAIIPDILLIFAAISITQAIGLNMQSFYGQLLFSFLLVSLTVGLTASVWWVFYSNLNKRVRISAASMPVAPPVDN